MTSPVVDPPNFTMSVKETLGLPFDPTDLLVGSQVPASFAATLVNLKSSVSVIPVGGAVLSGSGTTSDPYLITQPVHGPTDLVEPGTFLLTVTFNASPSINIWACELTIYAVA